ncbi:hypothetical protein BP5796_04180 [Coleophoma crateriformis]|uniref:BTB domain-containing protein n=1 Tax=Coleophoma crateriformis TaxID=565419 RepID=A0A3D8SHN0_9HELO|nr:hypothetical protein BP5796_04180 [Coleophoma crateriformis]
MPTPKAKPKAVRGKDPTSSKQPMRPADGTKTPPTMSTEPVQEPSSTILVDGEELPVIDIRATGDIILDVTFEVTPLWEKSIEGTLATDKMAKQAYKKSGPSAVRKLYRVRIDTLKKNSRYFEHLLGSDVFQEGLQVREHLEQLKGSDNDPSSASAEILPRLKIQDDEDGTMTYGREKVFEDMLRITHGGSHVTDNKHIGLHYLTVLVTMGEAYECLEPVARYLKESQLARYKYPANSTEETIRKKLLIFYLAKLSPLQANATFESCTKELVLKGSVRWYAVEDGSYQSTARWWTLPGGLEDELALRRKCILNTIASLVQHYLNIYTSKVRQCTLGYDSSPACDSFQLGEMIKFLTSKKLLSLSCFTGISPDDPEYVWPEAYTGSIEDLVTLLHQVPSYQIDSNHNHCGLRSRILKPLDHIKTCIAHGASVNSIRWFKNRDELSWARLGQIRASSLHTKAFEVNDEAVGIDKRSFVFDDKHLSMWASTGTGPIGLEKASKFMFTADEWDWKDDREVPVASTPSRFFNLNFR